MPRNSAPNGPSDPPSMSSCPRDTTHEGDARAGRAYLDLQNLARRQRKVTGELLTMYVVERWLARLAVSPYREDFILKGGMLLASLGARRPTADADALARNMAADEQTVVQRIV